MPFSKENRKHTLNGVLFVALFALSSTYLAEIPWIMKTGINSLVIAIVLGIAYSNTLHRLPAEWIPGVQFSAKQLLRIAIIFYGFRISFQQIFSVGVEGLILDILVISLTLMLGAVIGTKLFKLDRHLVLLISAGSAICGAAAVLAVESILKSEPYKATVAVGTVVLFGTISMFLYPFLQHIGIFGLSDNQFGLFSGASIHEVAQVVVAANDVSAQAGSIAIVVKMTRVLLLVPILFLLSNHKQANIRKNVPWFAIIFVAVIGFNSFNLLPMTAIKIINQLDTYLLTMAMAAIGIETNLFKLKKVGLKPIYLASILFFWLMGGVYFLVKL